jgi:aspartyl-tRNA(Asn)/glutamyl-tRNA(Gln) amidotransferase subunit C
MSQHHIDIHRVATLARLKLTDEEALKYGGQLEHILDYVGAINAHDLSNVEPTAHAMPVLDVVRDDTPAESFTSEQALSNAPKKNQGQFQMPRVVEE